MKLPKLIRFFISYVIVGVAVAIGVVIVYPKMQTQIPQAEPASSTQPPPLQPVSATTAIQASGPVSYADAVNRAAPAVVNIHTTKVVRERNPMLDDPVMRWFFGGIPNNQTRQRIERSLGSGVIIRSDGYILTNNHVIKNATEINVFLLDGREAKASIVGTDAATDLAVLKVDLKSLPSISVTHNPMPSVGDVVLAIGNPFGVGQTVTQGIVSATGRNQLGISAFENYIQTDAAINPGNSGGALINAHGELVGINTAIFSQSGGSVGIGFAIPVDLASQVLESIIQHGLVVRGWVGIEVQDISPALAESFGLNESRGALVAGILRGGPAADAGLRPGDILTAIDGNQINTSREIQAHISQSTPGKKIKLDGIRLGQPFTTQAVVIQRPQSVTR